MATFTIYYDKKRLSEGKEVKILIRTTQNKLHAYIETGMYISFSQVDKRLEIKDSDVLATLLQIRKKYKKWVDDEIGEDVASFKVADIKKFIERKLQGDNVDFFVFAKEYLENMVKDGRESTAAPIGKSVRGFKDFIKKEQFGCNSMTLDLLKEFGVYLKTKRKVIRKNQYGKDYTMTLQPLDDFGVGKYYVDIRSIFYAARELYNDDEAGVYVVKRNPFKKLEIKVKKTSGSLRSAEIEVFREILKMEDSSFRRVNMARDAILLSFMLMGMPPVDIYKVDEYKDGRISYKRSKTKDRSGDGAFISIKVYPEVELEKPLQIDPLWPNQIDPSCLAKLPPSACAN